MKIESTSGEDMIGIVNGPYRNTVAAFAERIRAEEREALCQAVRDGTRSLHG